MGGPWTYDHEPEDFAMSGADEEFLDELTGNLGAGVCGRAMYDASEAWGGTNPFDGPLFVVTHRAEDAPDPSTGFHFVDGLEAAMQRATEAAAGRDVSISGGADVIRQALAAGYVDELTISTAPLVLGGGKRLSTASSTTSSSRCNASTRHRTRGTCVTRSSADARWRVWWR
jgi:dihydrofolate reductase